MHFYYMYFKNCNFGEMLHMYIYWITICLAWSSVKKKNYENTKKPKSNRNSYKYFIII